MPTSARIGPLHNLENSISLSVQGDANSPKPFNSIEKPRQSQMGLFQTANLIACPKPLLPTSSLKKIEEHHNSNKNVSSRDSDKIISPASESPLLPAASIANDVTIQKLI
jgi:hypothetical protein